MISSIAPNTITLFTRGYIPNIDSGSTFPKDYEYNAALWIKTNTPYNTIIISDPITIEILSGLADKVPLALINMGDPSRPEDILRIEKVFQLFKADNDSDVYKLLNELKSMGINTEEFYRSFRPNVDISFIILVSQRTSLWIDAEMKYPIVYFNERTVKMQHINNFLNSNFFEISYEVEGEIYIFKPIADLFWNTSDLSSNARAPCKYYSDFETVHMINEVDNLINRTFQFDAVNNYSTVSNLDFFNLKKSLTSEAWFKSAFYMSTQHARNTKRWEQYLILQILTC